MYIKNVEEGAGGSGRLSGLWLGVLGDDDFPGGARGALVGGAVAAA